jgi:hypothetical protein
LVIWSSSSVMNATPNQSQTPEPDALLFLAIVGLT